MTAGTPAFTPQTSKALMILSPWCCRRFAAETMQSENRIGSLTTSGNALTSAEWSVLIEVSGHHMFHDDPTCFAEL